MNNYNLFSTYEFIKNKYIDNEFIKNEYSENEFIKNKYIENEFIKNDYINNNDYIDNNDYYLIQFDGGSRGNPGESAGGAIIYHINNFNNKNIITKCGKYIEYATNNQAEYIGLLCGIYKAKELNIKNILIEGDSLLVINQILNKWKIKNIILKNYYIEINELFKYFNSIGIKHIKRILNTEADNIVNIIINNKCNDI